MSENGCIPVFEKRQYDAWISSSGLRIDIDFILVLKNGTGKICELVANQS